MSSNTQKLRVIRSRTDHDLLILVQRELDRGLALVPMTTNRNSPLFAQAEKAYVTSVVLLSRISGLEPGDRLRVEGNLKELRSRLDRAPVQANVRPYSASFAS